MADEKKKKEKKEKPKTPPKAYVKKRSCPKCGSGISLAEHKDRRSCGKCGYSEKK